MRSFVFAWIALTSLLAAGCAVENSAPTSVARVHPGHPRLMMTDQTIPTLKAEIAEGGWMKDRYDVQKKMADRFMTEAVSSYELRGTDALLGTSRQVLDRVATLAIIYRVTGDRRYLDRCWQELDAAAQFPRWDPRGHFLSTAEMTAAFALGYDWLYDQWTQDQRATIRNAILEHGLRPGLAVYQDQQTWWPDWINNWNIVCNGGLAMGALAIEDESPGTAKEILRYGLQSVPKALEHFGPDGGWVEGPNYWSYATLYEAMYLDSLKTATGTDFGLGKIRGVSQTSWFPVYLNGNAGGPFNFGDAEDLHHDRSGPQLLWMARRFNEPRLAQYAIEHGAGRVEALDLIWGPGVAHEPWNNIPTERLFHHVEVASMRDSWDDPKGWFIATKAGPNGTSHGHLDVGTFVLDCLGVRWAVELGPDDYGLPGYFGKERWDYYRTRAEGNNTLVIDPNRGPDQSPSGAGKITSFVVTQEGADETADLTGVYPAADRVTRTIHFVRGQRARIKDDIRLKHEGDVWWFMQTAATGDPSPDGKTLVLNQDGKTMTLRLLSPAAGSFQIGPARPLPTSPHPPRQGVNTGISRVAIHLPHVHNATITVEFIAGPG